MKDFAPLRDVIAARDLEFMHADGRIEQVVVSIGAPFESEKDIEWRCPYSIKAESFEQNFGIAGADSMQALLLTVSIISTELQALERRRNGKFTQYGEPNPGFPIF